MPQPSKGERDQFTVRVPVDFAKILTQKAEEEGFRYTSEFFIELAARALDLPQFSPVHKENQLDMLKEVHSRAA
ncbi:hypothetical protein [Leucobacter manosquensis]|uniref:Toxin-antitoxin system HicB family antitoxin n=1 Tax=Leucobacter manosquensis TaxID=2810611 RepID=A0ABS5M8D1_9MICO|nr:hypothetical protein [Leucobacter manosquensis]MBS3183457.1 hypothetical protein [Leucobacter manosquensis]